MPRLPRRALAAAALSGLALPALAQSRYPDRTVTVIVPFAAGGPTDTVARLVAEGMGRELFAMFRQLADEAEQGASPMLAAAGL